MYRNNKKHIPVGLIKKYMLSGVVLASALRGMLLLMKVMMELRSCLICLISLFWVSMMVTRSSKVLSEGIAYI
jgi:hypothetical protein